MTSGRYAHLRECFYSFENETSEVEKFGVIENGCSANEPITILNETRETIGHDVFGQIMFMNKDFDTKVKMSCIVDACLPPAFGKKIKNFRSKLEI